MSADAPSVVADEEAKVDAATLGLLIDTDAAGLWSEDEVVRALDVPAELVADALARLAAAGLLHRLEGFVWPTRAADYAAQLPEG